MLMIAAMLSIPTIDGIAKYLSSDYSPLYISWARYIIASALIVPIGFIKFGGNPFPRNNLGTHFFRTACLMAAMTFYYLALADIPMATATAAFFVSPIVATLLAVLFFGESLTNAKMVSLALGLIGVLIIARPTTTIEPGILLALAAGVTFAVYMVATRIASKHSDPIRTLTFQCVVGSLMLTPFAIYAWDLPSSDVWHWFFAMGVISIVSHFLSIAAFQYAETSTLAPLVYLEVVASVLIGYYVFGDVPGILMAVGASLIIAGGLIVTLSEKT